MPKMREHSVVVSRSPRWERRHPTRAFSLPPPVRLIARSMLIALGIVVGLALAAAFASTLLH